MGIKTRAILKSWFKRGSYPTEAQFGDLIDSMRHREEKISISEVSGLTDELNRKSDSSLAKTVAEHSIELKMLQDVAWGTNGPQSVSVFDGIDTGEDLEINWDVGYNAADEVVYLSNYGMFAVKVSGATGMSDAMRIVGGYGYVYYPVFSSATRSESDYQTVESGSAKIHETKLFRLKESDELYVWQSAVGQLERTSKVQPGDLSMEVSLFVEAGELHIRSNRSLGEGESIWLMRNGKYTTEQRIRDGEEIRSGVRETRKGWRRYEKSNHQGESYGIDMPFEVERDSEPLHGRNLVGGGGPQYWTYRINLPAHIIVESLAYMSSEDEEKSLCIRNGKKKKRLKLGAVDDSGELKRERLTLRYGIAVYKSVEESIGKIYSERRSDIAPFRVEVKNYRYDEAGELIYLEEFRGQGELSGYCHFRVE